MAISQVMARQRTGVDVLGLGTGPADLFVAAAMEMPVGLELGAAGTWPSFWSMSCHAARPCFSMYS